MKYVAIRDSFGFRNTYWYKGDTVEVSKGEKVPPHFEPLDKKAAPEDDKEQKSDKK